MNGREDQANQGFSRVLFTFNTALCDPQQIFPFYALAPIYVPTIIVHEYGLLWLISIMSYVIRHSAFIISIGGLFPFIRAEIKVPLCSCAPFDLVELLGRLDLCPRPLAPHR